MTVGGLVGGLFTLTLFVFLVLWLANLPNVYRKAHRDYPEQKRQWNRASRERKRRRR